MSPVRIFISHRAEYAGVAQDLKEAIELAPQRGELEAPAQTSQKRVEVFLSEDIPHGNQWLLAIKEHLREAKGLILIYGAPYEDWSWCFYEAGYFAAVDPGASNRRIYCIVRPTVPIPGPLSDLQAVKGRDDLIRALTDIYELNGVEVDAGKLRTLVTGLENRLFGQLTEFEGYRRVHFIAPDAEFGANGEIPGNARLTGDDTVLGDLFRFHSNSVRWADVVAAAHTPAAEENFVPKWIEETTTIIVAARRNEFIAPQTVLIGRAGRRWRTLLHRARIQADGTYSCEFLAIEDVGGPTVGLSSQQLSLLNSIRMGFRFRSEVIKKFPYDFHVLSQEDRRARIQEIPRVIENLTVESKTHGDISMENLLTAFDDKEGERLQKLVGYWPTLQRELYKSMGLSSDGKTVLREGLLGPDVERFRTAFNALKLLNIEFLSRCCARVPRMMKKSERELSDSAKQIDQAVRALTRPRPDALPERQQQSSEPGRTEFARGKILPAERAHVPSDHAAI
jgi:hypothetical protein